MERNARRNDGPLILFLPWNYAGTCLAKAFEDSAMSHVHVGPAMGTENEKARKAWDLKFQVSMIAFNHGSKPSCMAEKGWRLTEPKE